MRQILVIRLGEALAAMSLTNGSRGIGKKVESHATTPLLSDLGITKDQSHRWQKLAAGHIVPFSQTDIYPLAFFDFSEIPANVEN
jgi:hypothetical protein